MQRLDLTHLYQHLSRQSVLRQPHQIVLNPDFQLQSPHQSLSRQKIARQMGRDRTTLARWTNRPQSPKLSDINKLTLALGVYSPLAILSVRWLDQQTETALPALVAQIMAGLSGVAEIPAALKSGLEDLEPSLVESYLSSQSVLSQSHQILLSTEFQFQPSVEEEQQLKLNTLDQMAERVDRDRTTLGRWRRNPQGLKLGDINRLAESISLYSPLAVLSVQWSSDQRQMTLLELLEEVLRGFVIWQSSRVSHQQALSDSGLEHRLRQIEHQLAGINKQIQGLNPSPATTRPAGGGEIEDLLAQFRQLPSDEAKRQFVALVSQEANREATD
jgi:transcriptional regulator with XRE-family HTH domain